MGKKRFNMVDGDAVDLQYPTMEPNDKEVKMGKQLGVYSIVAVDRQECTVVKEKVVVGTEADKGMLDLDLSTEQRNWLKTGRLAVYQQLVGSFERYVPEVQLKDVKIQE